jgi:hypothetical protein
MIVPKHIKICEFKSFLLKVNKEAIRLGNKALLAGKVLHLERKFTPGEKGVDQRLDG